MPPPFDAGEFFDAPPDAQPSSFLQEATVGWEGSAEITELGTESGDGVTLVRITLFTGAPEGKPVSADGFANGAQRLARVGGPVKFIPKRGQQVLVAVLAWNAPGRDVILCTLGPDVTPDRFGRKKTVLDFGDDDVVIAGKSVSLFAELDDGSGTVHRHVVSVSGEGGAQVVSDGSGFFCKDGEVDLKTVDGDGNLMAAAVLNQESISLIDAAGTGTVVLKGGNVSMLGQYVSISAITGAFVGKNADMTTPVLIGGTGIDAVLTGPLDTWIASVNAALLAVPAPSTVPAPAYKASAASACVWAAKAS